jgi:SnoaL-like domain
MALRLEDIELIKQLKHRYMRCLDTADVEGLKCTMHPDITIRYIGGSYRIEADGRDNVLNILSGMYNKKYAGSHIVHHPEIEVADDGETATGIWYLTDYAMNFNLNITTQGAAIYRDKYVKQDGKWVILHSGYTRMWERVEKFDESTKPNLAFHLYATLDLPDSHPGF